MISYLQDNKSDLGSPAKKITKSLTNLTSGALHLNAMQSLQNTSLAIDSNFCCITSA